MMRANMKIFIAAVASAFLSTATPAMAIEGRYRIEGRITAEKRYAGEAIVRRSGEVYAIAWQTSAGRHVGTALLEGNVLSIVFRDQSGRETPGVGSFVVEGSQIVRGRWATLGTNQTGTEAWTLIER